MSLTASRQVVAGHALLVAVLLSSTSPVNGAVTATDAAGNSYVIDRDQKTTGSGFRMLVLSARNVKALAAGAAITLTLARSAQYQVSVDEFSGITGPDKSASAWGTTAAFSSGATSTTSQPTELLYGEVGNKSGGVPTWASGWSALPTVLSGSNGLTAAYQVSTAQGSYSTSGTITGTWMAAIVTYTADNPPIAVLAVTKPSGPPLTVIAKGSGSTDTDFTPIASYQFNFGDGTPAVTVSAPSDSAMHTYASAGTYTVTLIVTDTGDNASAPATVSITVTAPPPDNPPVASLTVTPNSNPGLTVTADASGSTDTDSTPISSYRFDFGDGSAAVTTSAPTATTSHTYATGGTYTVTLLVTDTGGKQSAPATASVTVTAPPPDNPPVASLTVTPNSNPGLSVTADASGSTDTDSTPISSYRFDFGDGSAAVTTNAPTATASHTYATGGTYTVTLLVTDTGGKQSAPATASVTVIAPPAVSYVGRVASATSSSSSTSATLTASRQVAAGDAILVAVLLSSTALTGAVNVTDSAGNTYTLDRDQNDGSANDRTLVFSAKNARTLPVGGTVKLTYSTAAAYHVSVDEFQGVIASDKIASATGTGTSFSSGSTATTTQPTELLFGVLGEESGVVPTWASGWTTLPTLSISSDRLTAAYRVTTASGAYAASGTVSGTWMATVVTYTSSGAPQTDNPPVASLTVTPNSSPGLTVTADGSGSTDTDSTPIASYRFDFGDGSAAVSTNAPTATASHTYATGGTYSVTLIVTDTAGKQSASATASVTVTAPPPAGSVAVYAGYYDTHHPNNLQPKPDPWMGASNVGFIGTPDNSSGGWDTSAIRIDNLTSGSISGVTVTCDMGSNHFALWGTTSIPAKRILILAQTGFENFDGSDTSPAGCYSCPPSDCTTKVSSTIPVVHVTIGSTHTDYLDTGQVLNTHGVDAAGCPYTGTRNDESENWVRISPASADQALASEARASRGGTTPVRRDLWLTASPNPTQGDINISFSIPEPGPVRLGVHDVTGRLVKMCLNGALEAGEHHQWVRLDGAPAGIYFCDLWTRRGIVRSAIVLVRVGGP